VRVRAAAGCHTSQRSVTRQEGERRKARQHRRQGHLRRTTRRPPGVRRGQHQVDHGTRLEVGHRGDHPPFLRSSSRRQADDREDEGVPEEEIRRGPQRLGIESRAFHFADRTQSRTKMHPAEGAHPSVLSHGGRNKRSPGISHRRGACQAPGRATRIPSALVRDRVLDWGALRRIAFYRVEAGGLGAGCSSASEKSLHQQFFFFRKHRP
jgi:hypothetical protein